MNPGARTLTIAAAVALFSTAMMHEAAAQSITVTPSTSTIQAGQTQQFAADVSTAATADAGDYHACILLQNGEARCSGFNTYGQLGNGTEINSSTPVPVFSISHAVSVSSGGFHSCAALQNGTVFCWGRNDEGQLGDGTTTKSSVPVAVSGITTATAVAAGYHHSCALLQDGTVRCWGDDSYGELGDGAPIDPSFPRGGDSVIHSSVPVTVSGIDTAVSVTASDGYHSCAVLQDGTVWCWGDNSNGQLGNGTRTRSAVPVAAGNITSATRVSSGDFHTCALLQNGTVRCWGLNYSGQLGDGSGSDSSVPVPVSGISTAVAVSVGVIHTCAVLQDGTARCWGNNSSGQIGDGTTANRLTPAIVTGITTATGSVAAGNNDSCVIIQGGVAKCWGLNTFGELGIGTTGDVSVPASVSGINPTWTTSDSTVATIDETGLAIGVGPGSTTITAAFEGRSGTASLTVGAVPVLTVGADGDGIITSGSGEINCGTSCSASYQLNAVVTLTATPLNGSGLTAWSGCDSSGAATCTVTMSAARSITATFRRPLLTLTKTGPGRGSVSSTGSGGDCGADVDTCIASQDIGTTLTLTATPIYGSQFDAWTGCGANGRFCSVTMDASKLVTARFTLTRFMLTVDKPGVGSGTVTAAQGGIACGSVCAASYDYGTVVTLTATPALGSVFNGWSGCDATSDGTCTVTIGADKWVSANFLGVPLQ